MFSCSIPFLGIPILSDDNPVEKVSLNFQQPEQKLIALVTSTAMLQKKNCTTNFCFALFLSIFRLFFIPF